MDRLSAEEYAALLEGATVLSRDGYGEKVVQLGDGLMLKAFRLKRPWSTGRWKPYALRFVENAARLRQLGVPTVEVTRLAYCAERKRHLVIYRPLAGVTLRDALAGAAPERVQALLTGFAGFLAELHGRGVYFRSVHFGNVVLTGDGRPMGLIDIADMRFRVRALRPVLRARNFRHLARYAVDRQALETCGIADFLAAYLERADLSRRAAEQFRQKLAKDQPLFAGPTS